MNKEDKTILDLSEQEGDDIILEEEGDDIATETINKLRKKLKQCEADKGEYLSGWQRSKADFINARREEDERKLNFTKLCEQNLIKELLEVADSFDSLFENKELWKKIDVDWQKGLEGIYMQFINILSSHDVKIISTKGEKYNPAEHEVVEEIEVDNREKEGIIIEEVRKGYKLHNKIIRASQVKIGKIKESLN